MSTISTTVKINDAFSSPLDRLSSGLQKAQSGMSRLKQAISGGSSGGGSMFKSMVGGTVVGGAINKGMELAGTGIRSMYGELDEASKAWQTFEGNMHQLGKVLLKLLLLRSQCSNLPNRLSMVRQIWQVLTHN